MDSTLQDSSSTTAPLIPREDESNPQQVTYPYQAQFNKVLNTTWIYYIILIPLFIDGIGKLYYSSEDFFYPCSYTNMISVNDTLDIQRRFNETQLEIQSFKSLLSNSDITPADSGKYNSLLENAIEKSSSLNKEYQFHKSNWEVCFHQNYYSYDQKILLLQFCFSLFDVLLILNELFTCLQYTSKLKQLQLTNEQKDAYEKDWKGLDGFKWRIGFKCAILFFFACATVIYFMRLIFDVTDSVQMPLFN